MWGILPLRFDELISETYLKIFLSSAESFKKYATTYETNDFLQNSKPSTLFPGDHNGKEMDFLERMKDDRQL